MKLRAGRKDLWLCLAVAAALTALWPTSAVAATDATFGGISSDGTKAFFNSADQLTEDDTDGQVDVYRRSGTTTTRISVGAINGNLGLNASFAGASADGNRVFFTTTEQLASTDTDSSSDAYERFGSTTTQVSTGAINGNSPIAVTFERASTDGLHVFFSTTEALVAGDADGSRDIYERFNGVITRISAGAINGNGAFDAAFAGSSSDGTHVFFTTNEPLVSADTDTRRDIYERFGGGTTLVSTGAQNANTSVDAAFGKASSDGLHVFFTTAAALETSDGDSRTDVYARNAGATTQVSLGAINGNGSFDVEFGGISDDASVVVFETAEPLENGDTDSSRDVYKRVGGVTSGITTSRDGAFDANFEAVNSTGSRIAFTTAEPSCGTVDVDTETDVYTHQAAGGTVCNSANGNGPFPVKFAAIGPSATLYTTQEAVASQDGDEATDLYVDNAVVSQGVINGNGGFPAKFAAISDDASRIFFTSFEQLVPQDVDDRSDVYLRSSGGTSLISIEVIPPVATITAGVADAGFTKDDTPVFEFTSSEPGSTFVCTVDGSGPAPCSSPKVLGSLTDGTHDFAVRATDPAGNSSGFIARTFTVDTISPDPVIDSGPPALTRDSTPTFTFSADEPVTFACRIDGDPYAACSEAGAHTTATLADGLHSFRLRARDEAGNTEHVGSTFTVDATPPETTIDSVVVNGTKATVRFSGTDANTPLTFQCRIDSGRFSGCRSGKVFNGLAAGPHTIRVRARDKAGNLDRTPASQGFSV